MILKLYSTGPEVKQLQAALLSAGFDPQSEDGSFGPDTDTAVRRFQAAHGLTVDGAVAWPEGETADALCLTSDAPVVSDEAVALTESFEGFSAFPYQDSVGVWTYGFGSTRDFNGNPVTHSTPPVTRIQATGLMRRDMTKAATEVSKDVRVPLTPGERAALDDFIYNVGEGAFAGSTLLRKLNAGDYEGAANEFLRWTHAGGQVLAGLLRRRQAERAEFLKTGATP